MKKLSAIQFVSGVAVVLISSQVFAVECAVEIEMAAHTKTIDLQLEPAEIPMNSLLLLPNNRAAAGTGVSPEGDTIITGGRFIVTDIGTGRIETAIEPPTLEGRPTMVGVVARSNDGKYVTATGGYLFGGPALLYEADPSFRYRGSHQVTRNRLSVFADQIVNLTVRAAQGDRLAEARLNHFFPGGVDDLKGMHESQPESFRQTLLNLFARSTGIPNEEERVPVMNVQFHPDGKRFLLNSGDSVSIRNAVDGRVLHDIALHDVDVPHSMDPPLAYFMGGGDQVMTLSRQFLSLWDVKTGQPLDARDHTDELGNYYPMVNSPNAEFFSYTVDAKEGLTRQIWTVVPREGEQEGKQLKMVASYVHNDPAHRTHAPTIAFSGKSVYAVGKAGGVVELHDMKTHALLADGEIHVGSPQERADLYVPHVAMDYSGKWLVISARSKHGDFLELWSVENRKGVRMRIPPLADPTRHRYISEVEFDPKGEWFSFIVSESAKLPPRPGVIYVGGPRDEYKIVTSTPYVVDVYKAIANAIQQPKMP